MQMARQQEIDQRQACTFSPRITSWAGQRLKKRTKSALEPNDIKVDRPSTNNNVFLNLYELGKQKVERSMSSQRIAKEYAEAKELGGCTFKPDFSKTQEISRRYLNKKKVDSHKE